MKRKRKLPLANEAAAIRHDNKVHRQRGVDPLDKKMPSSRQTAAKEDKTEEKDCQPDLNLDQSKPRRSE